MNFTARREAEQKAEENFVRFVTSHAEKIKGILLLPVTQHFARKSFDRERKIRLYF
jgi:hypothetical protein